ncbi:MAG TPA: hypothetical protein VNH44_07910 [Micropepsaceae bacterium]|nr:hypothetical protein [Micropepsaceae bacterium]
MKRCILATSLGLAACVAAPQTDSRAAIDIAANACVDTFGPQLDFDARNWHIGVIDTDWVAWTGTEDRSDCDYIVQISMADRSVGLGCLICFPDAP